MSVNGPSNGRGVILLDVQSLRACLAILGWSLDDLADSSGVPKRSIERALKNKACRTRLHGEILEAIQSGMIARQERMGLELTDIPDSFVKHDDIIGQEVITEERTVPIEITINADFDTFTIEQQQRIMKAVQLLLETNEEIRVKRIRPGSVKITIEMSPRDAEQLLWAIKAGELSHVDVTDAEVLRDPKSAIDRAYGGKRQLMIPLMFFRDHLSVEEIANRLQLDIEEVYECLPEHAMDIVKAVEDRSSVATCETDPTITEIRHTARTEKGTPGTTCKRRPVTSVVKFLHRQWCQLSDEVRLAVILLMIVAAIAGYCGIYVFWTSLIPPPLGR